MITENLSTLKINKLTQEQFDRELAAGNIDENAIYLTPDEEIDFSLYATVEQVNGKADVTHTHDDIYYTQSQIDSVLEGKADTVHNHDSSYDSIGAANSALTSAKEYTDSAVATAKNDLLNGAGEAYDTLKELGDLINENIDAIDALEIIASSKADAEHTHEIADITNLQSALDEKASKDYVDDQVATKTAVTVGGNPVQTFDADTKLSYPDNFAVSEYYRLFGLNTNSDKVRTFNIAITPNGCLSGNIPRFNSPSTAYSGQNATGTFWVATPTQEQHVANKKYVDDTVNTMGDTKVDKVEGKELSTNDLTDELKSNYDIAYTHSQTAHAPSNAQANKIESIKVNGTAQTITSKSVDITVPTKVSELENDSSFATTTQVATDIATAKQEAIDTAATDAQSYTDNAVKTKTSVTIGGVHQEAFDADTKVDKTTVAHRVYCTDGNGNQSTRTISSSPTAGAVPIYGTSGILPVGDPTADSSAANKKYVDDQLDSKVSKSGDTMTGTLQVPFLTVEHPTTNYPSIAFKENENSATRGTINYDNTNNRMYFGQYHSDQDTATTRYLDGYILPTATSGKTANNWYNILTSKNAVTVAQGGTGATTASAARTNLGAMSATNPTGTGSFSLNRKSGTTVGDKSHAEGRNATASGMYSHAEGDNTSATGKGCHSEGYYTTASGNYSHAGGYYTAASYYQTTVGKYNKAYDNASVQPDTQDTSNTDALFIVGCGTSSAAKNAFRVTTGGKCYGSAAFGASGADFAELFEWADGNPNNEDRRGLFVALDGEKIRLANANDDYIGVISGAQAFIGNSASEEWNGKYLSDVFGTKLSQEVEVPEEKDEVTGEVITPAHTTTQYVLNPEYDPNEEYIMRENRKEWGIVGLLGQIIMIDDGTCTVGGYVKPSINGIGTASDSGYRVMKRVDENHIKVLVK